MLTVNISFCTVIIFMLLSHLDRLKLFKVPVCVIRLQPANLNLNGLGVSDDANWNIGKLSYLR